MRTAILSLFLSGTAAFCQSPAPAPVTPQPLWQTPLVPPPLSGRDFSKLPPGWHSAPPIEPKMMLVPNPADTSRSKDAQIDPEIIVHPPPSSIGAQAPGAAVAQKEYPHLRMLPIDSANHAREEISTAWPCYRLDAIPTQRPMHEIMPVRGDSEVVQFPGN